MDNTGRIVIETSISWEAWDNWDYMAARIRELGLTAYGRTKDEARTAVKHLFHEFITMHRELGDLDVHLKEIGIVGHSETEYQQRSGLHYEITQPFPPSKHLRAGMRAKPSLPSTEHAPFTTALSSGVPAGAADEPTALAA